MNWITLIGLLAAICTSISFAPQAIKTIRTKSTKDISLSMYLILTVGFSLWLIYGLTIKDIPLILANTISLSLAMVILILKIKHG